VTDETGAGVGGTDDGYVVMIEGIFTPSKARVRIDNVKSNYSEGTVVEELEEEDDVNSNEDEEDDRPCLSSREDFFG
jgi:tRNA/tmRNA/rRNA uracil-C5-methylase (TrmA/RlmC/RlmD family)